MTDPQRPDSGDIADTQMFRRFVAEEQPASSSGRTWAIIGGIVAIIVIALVIALIVR